MGNPVAQRSIQASPSRQVQHIRTFNLTTISGLGAGQEFSVLIPDSSQLAKISAINMEISNIYIGISLTVAVVVVVVG